MFKGGTAHSYLLLLPSSVASCLWMSLLFASVMP